jgi:Ni,Fe-hydrogenase III small subunit
MKTLGIFARRSQPETADPADPETTESLRARLDAAAQTRLGRSVAIRHVNTGSCHGCELELRALNNVLYDLERFGLCFVESPRHADVLLVTGPLTRNLRSALEQAWDATPDPKWVVAVGDCAVDGGVFKGSYAVLGGAGLSVPVDLTINGCPPSPARILAGLRTLLEANAVERPGPQDKTLPVGVAIG